MKVSNVFRRCGFAVLVLAGVACAVLTVTLQAARGADSPTPAAGRKRDLVYYFPDTVGRNRADIAAFYQAWVTAHVTPALGSPVEVVYFSELADLERYMDICRAKGDWPLVAALSVEVARENRDRWGLEVHSIPVRTDGSHTHRIVVASRRGGPVAHLEDLRGRVVAAPAYWGRDVERFERKVLGGRLRLAEIGELQATNSSTSALMAVHFGQADAALVSNRVFEVLQERAAATWRSMRVIHESEVLPLAVIVTFPGLTDREKDVTLKAALKIHNTIEGRRFLDYVRFSHFVPGSFEDLFGSEDSPARLPPAQADR
ncbi:MAG: PhnD/SsuA/transferrin family substrate-binding protein [Candidatus Schekmanbacteria bacterium]|nr:PhnD/SsuA/transferrin family substrate-binding protein [Candidatus Schekmanbacteria bacterium]